MAAAISILQIYANPVFVSPVFFKNKTQSVFSRHAFQGMKINAAKSTEQPFEGHEYLSLKVKQVNKALYEVFESLPKQHPNEVQEAMKYSMLSGGKRTRAILCLASAVCVGGDESVAMPMTCAIEMIQAMTLMFDDLPCMDNDDVRRGLPSNHKMFGEEVTILAGTSLVFLAFHHTVNRPKSVSPELVMRCITELSSAIGFDGIQGGQLLDVRSEGKQVTLAQLDRISSMKTGKFYEASVVCGAIIGGGNDMEIERLRMYGRHMGYCAQVVNDILDLTKLYEHGKTAKNDSMSGKLTYAKLMGVDGAKKCVEERLAKAMEELAHFETSKAAPLYYLANDMANLLVMH